MNNSAKTFIDKFFNNTVASDDKTVLVNNFNPDSKIMSELANIAKQAVTVEINEPGDIKTLADGEEYVCVLAGWEKQK